MQEVVLSASEKNRSGPQRVARDRAHVRAAKKILVRGENRLAPLRSHAMVRPRFNRLSRIHDEHHARQSAGRVARDLSASAQGAQGPAGGDDKSLGRNRKG
jgi:hypothetical protein